MTATPDLTPLENADYDALEDILDDLRSRGEDVPQWEFLEGAMAALICTRMPPFIITLAGMFLANGLLTTIQAHLLTSTTLLAQRGVRVVLIVPRRNDSWIVAGASRSTYSDLLLAGVEVIAGFGNLPIGAAIHRLVRDPEGKASDYRIQFTATGVDIVSTGPDRTETIILRDPFGRV